MLTGIMMLPLMLLANAFPGIPLSFTMARLGSSGLFLLELDNDDLLCLMRYAL